MAMTPQHGIDLVAAFEIEPADTYRMIAGKFQSLADDESKHRAYTRREHAKLPPAATAPSTDRRR